MRRRKREEPVSWEDAASVCGWCGKRIPEDSEVFALGAKVRPGAVLEHDGNVIELALDATHKALVIVPTEESEAKQMGWDLLFTVCSEECGKVLKETVQEQIDFIDSILTGR